MAHRFGIAVCLVVALALASCGGGGGGSSSFVLASSPYATPGGGTGTAMSAADEARSSEAVDWINGHRVANGLAPLTWHGPLATVCYAHCVDMYTRGFFSHTNPDGDEPWDRVSAAGISYTAVGENIAQGYPTGQAVAEGWMNSEGHRRNILDGNYTRVAVACYAAGGTYYWTNLFIRE